MTRRVLLLGGSGQVGTALGKLLTDFVAPTRADFDLAGADHTTVRALFDDLRLGAVINCAAYTAVDRAEAEPDLANRINARAVGILAEVAAACRLPFVTYSTDYVFDGRTSRPYVESDSPHPLNEYGRSKLLGERLAGAADPNCLIIRTSWVLSDTHPNFVSKVLHTVKAGDRLEVVDDQLGCPTIASDLAATTWEALNQAVSGVLHVTNSGATSWFGLARYAVSIAGMNPELVTPCSTEDHPRVAERPRNSVLSTARLRRLGLEELPPWKASVEHLVRRVS